MTKNKVLRPIMAGMVAMVSLGALAMPTRAQFQKMLPPVKSFDIGKGVKMEFVQCPAGTFLMGAEQSLWMDKRIFNDVHKCDNTNTRYPHKVTITRPFWMSKYPITIRQWDVISPEKYGKSDNAKAFGLDAAGKFWTSGSPDCPEFEQFLQGLRYALKGKLPKGYVVRLPTEAEFEYAFKANSTDENDPHRRIWQKVGININELSEIAYPAKELYKMLEQKGITVAGMPVDKPNDQRWMRVSIGLNNPVFFGTVGKKKPNGWGLYDMMMGTPCLDVVSCTDHGLTDLAYEEEETDPLRISKKIGKDPKTGDKEWKVKHLMYRPEFACSGSFAGGVKMFGWAVTAVRLVIGPDLEKEKGVTK